ncbi:pirin family protein [Ancylobacter oerskovii]|uniref:Pirin family protein n=1 Tax=Ancylobacter oerskovii TaxID=459519 RepID=A0ABW4Z4T8_9HYPH|nr:pirin family protein [Ancylobacter oerskovii]MBS7542482.1 pirin family protein [Ancylobacter oerskovii]
MEQLKIEPAMRRGDWNSGFSIEIFYPGDALNTGDSGIGAFGRIDRARIQAGHVIAMHPHRDDEILTYLRAGTMLHRDSVGNEERLSPSRLMMMNAGREFQHEEEMLGSQPVEALQIFMRPRVASLDARVQFHDFDDALSRGAWRLLAAPQGAPFEVRGQAWVQDAHLAAGEGLTSPKLPADGAERFLHVFAGEVFIDGVEVHAGETLYLAAADWKVMARTVSDLVLFTTDADAPVFAGGMFSGNVRAVRKQLPVSA